MTRKSRLKASVSAAALLGLSFAVAAEITPAAADKVGVAAAVKPDAFSTLAGAPQSQLNIGKSIFFNERIKTTTSGLVQVLLVDGSTFTVGPDSDLVINKFIYDPNKGTGQIAASFSKGVMRFVGGKISKAEDAVSINTPVGAMAVRGCIILTQVTPATQVAGPSATLVFVYGKSAKFAGEYLFANGTQISVSSTGKVETGKASPELIGKMLAGLSNKPQNNGGDSSDKPAAGPKIQMIETADLTQAVNDANTLQITTEAEKAEADKDTASASATAGEHAGLRRRRVITRPTRRYRRRRTPTCRQTKCRQTTCRGCH